MQQLEIPVRQERGVAVKVTTVTTPTHLLGWLPIFWTQGLLPGKAPTAEPWNWRSFASIFFLSGILLYPCLSFFLFEPDEGRYAQIPREMLTAGEWIVPTLQGEPYLDKPPLFYWLVMLAYCVFGYHDWAARLVPAMAMHATILVAHGLGRRLVGDRPAFWGSLLLIVSPIFLGVGRLLTLDGLLTLWVSVAMLAIYRASEPDAPARDAGSPLAGASGSNRRSWWIAAALACGFGVLTKGPIALVLVAPPILAHRWLVGGPAISWRAWGGFLAIVAFVNLPWYVAACIRQPEFVSHFLWQHNVQRFVEPFDHVRPVWFYVPIVLYGLMPILLLAWPIARFLTSTMADDANCRCPALGYLLLAGGWCILFFSMSGCKLPTYVLPAFVPLCLALGCFVARTDWHRSRWTIGLVIVAGLMQIVANYYAIPAYARSKSPMAHMEEMRAYGGDPEVPVVCFPRNADSVAFYLGRSDFRTYRSKEMGALIDDLRARPRTVVLFGHRNSPTTLAAHLPRNLRMTERRPMGLCEMAVIERAD